MFFHVLQFVIVFLKKAEKNHCVQVTQYPKGGIGIPSPD
jgi:hypothetical protein